METKVCSICKKEKPINDFYKAKLFKDGHMYFCKECDRERKKKYKEGVIKDIEKYEKIKKKNKEYNREYKKNNREIIKERKRLYRKTEKGKIQHKIEKQKRKARLKQTECAYKSSDWLECIEYFNNKCCYCGEQKELYQEHFVPLNKGGEYTKNNIIPACKSCNSSKQDRDFEEWYKTQPFYSEIRKKKIYKYLNYKDGVQQLSLII
jgi:5-methylcytosine-specific restriction endonuclease McrA